MSVLDRLHGDMVHTRRVRVLVQHLAPLVPRNATLLDVGCGDGRLAGLLLEQRPDLTIEGVDVLVRPDAAIPVREFDGVQLPWQDDSFDAAMLVDVVHHAAAPEQLLADVRRVVRRHILIKDHFRNGWLAQPRLSFMDWVGNARHGVALPCNYWSRAEWEAAWRRLECTGVETVRDLRLYPPPAEWVFGGGLHFVARLAFGGAGGEGTSREAAHA